MSTSVAKAYANTVRKNQKVLYAVWEPGLPVELGDYGTMKGNIFEPLGNIREIEALKDFKITTRLDPTQDEKTFTSQKGVEYKLIPKASASVQGVPVNASIEFKFSEENAVFFNAAGCVFEMIENKHQLGQKILEIFRDDDTVWNRDFVLVTALVHAKRALILVSTSSDFAIGFEAKAEIPAINLASASLDLNLKFQNSSGYKVNAEEGLIPLIGLGKIQRKTIFHSNEFGALDASSHKSAAPSGKGEYVLEFDDYTSNKEAGKD
ncbi:hypothetical protein H1R16_09880 [Marnyiella aurantia]|uniref:Uncharacterized protein n=1 Tax=Marnyiella aurantia TaxID=2758037 RepID=A0A7D7LT13_9FLAO|nr:hypothetical protein [Marnyiella aurantia]MBA5246632.1 hypothetical protein [Marnyiella aurantia]MBP0612430.1 hypothetical protein [Marnyiella aurantia]QMS98013.1 hypothetical protein H1R16_09880 [Marnyiella aurantia]